MVQEPGIRTPRPRVGVVLLASAWMREVGLDTEGGGLADRVQGSARTIVSRLGELCDPVFPGVALSPAEAARIAGEIASSGCDAALVVPMVWCEDQLARAALSRLGELPLILGTLVPHDRLPAIARFEEMLAGSGTVGALQASGLLRREGKRFAAVCGRVSDPAVYREIAAHARAASAARSLRASRIGMLPWRCEAMSVTWVDEVGLRTTSGVELVTVEIGRLEELARSATAAELEAFRRALAARGIAIRTDPASLEQGMRVALGVARIARDEGLCGLALNDLAPEMHRAIGLRPCLPELGLADSGFVVAMEADVALTVTMRALGLFTGSSPFYTEIFTLDLASNCLLMGHAGWHAPANADPAGGAELIPDVEYQAVDRYPGAAIYYALPPGPVTAVNAVWREGSLRWSVFEGESLGGRHLEGNCHLLCRPREPVAELISRMMARGVSQHWTVIPGLHGADVDRLASCLGIPSER